MDARFNEIQEAILTARNEVSELNALEVLTTNEVSVLSAKSISKVGQWRVWVFIYAFGLWLLEKSIIQNSNNTKEQNLVNLKAAILNFHDGLELVWINNSWGYDFTGVVNPDERKIIKKCAIIQPIIGGLIVKITGQDAPLEGDQYDRFQDYITKKKVPGIPVEIINENADLLQLEMNVYVDSQIIDLTTGKLLNTTEDIYPVKNAIESYLSKLEFNGSFVKLFFEKEIKEATGVYLVDLTTIKWKYGAFPFIDFGAFKSPESGWFKINPEDLTINYLSDAVVYN